MDSRDLASVRKAVSLTMPAPQVRPHGVLCIRLAAHRPVDLPGLVRRWAVADLGSRPVLASAVRVQAPVEQVVWFRLQARLRVRSAQVVPRVAAAATVATRRVKKAR